MLESLVVTLALYRRVFARAAELAVKNWPVLGSIFAYSALLIATSFFAAFLGPAAGLVNALVFAMCGGSFLYLVEMIVRTNRVNWEDFRHSFGPYFRDVVGVMFVWWLFRQFAMPLLLQVPQGGVIVLCIVLVVGVLFNAVPELIYLGHYSLAALFSQSYEFIANNWIEWFPPNFVLIALLVALWQVPAAGLAAGALQTAAIALFLYFAMVVRGLLFIELDGTTRRARIFRHKMGR